MKRPPYIQFAALFILFSAGAWATQAYIPDLTQQLKDTYSSFTEPDEATRRAEIIETIEIEAPTPRIIPQVPKGLIKREYDKHLFAAEYNGIGLIESEDHLISLIEDEKLVLVDKGTGYEVLPLTHSKPYITAYSKKVLEEIGVAFQSVNDSKSYFSITSVTRTPDQQKSLRKRNSNATNGQSSHSYGVSFDISYIRYNGEKNWSRKNQRNLRKILKEFEDAGKIFFIRERKQSCFHVTVR